MIIDCKIIVSDYCQLQLMAQNNYLIISTSKHPKTVVQTKSINTFKCVPVFYALCNWDLRFTSAWHYLHKYSSYLPPGTSLCRTPQLSDSHAHSPKQMQEESNEITFLWEVRKKLSLKDQAREGTLTKETTLFVITPPNKLFTVFFCEWMNKFCQGNLSKSVSFQAPFCSLLTTHQFWRHFLYFCY